MIGDEWQWDAKRQNWRKDLAAFLREPNRSDLNLAKPPRPLDEPRHYRRELDRRREITTAELLGLLAFALAVGFCLGAYFYA